MKTLATTILITALLITAPPFTLAAENGAELPYPPSLLQDLQSGDEATRLSAIQAIKPYRETTSLPRLLTLASEDPSSQIRLQAVGAVWNREDIRAARVLEKMLILEKDEEVRLAIAGALGDVGTRATTPAFLVNTIQSNRGDNPLVARCLRSLGRLKDLSSAGTVAGFLSQDQPPEVRGTAAEALGLMDAGNQARALVDILETDPNNTVRSLAAQALGRIGTDLAAEPLVRILLFDPSDIVRHQGAVALGHLRMTSSIYEALIDGLRDTSKNVRFACLVNLSERLRRDDTDAVAELLADERKGIRELAHQILSRRGIVMERVGDRYRLVE